MKKNHPLISYTYKWMLLKGKRYTLKIEIARYMEKATGIPAINFVNPNRRHLFKNILKSKEKI